MKKIVAGLAIVSLAGGASLIGMNTIKANAQEKTNISNIELDLKSILEGKDLLNWEDKLDKKYGDDWDDLLDKKYGDNWEDKFERRLSELYPNQIIEDEVEDDMDDKYDTDDKDDDKYDMDDKYDVDDKDDDKYDMDDKYDVDND